MYNSMQYLVCLATMSTHVCCFFLENITRLFVHYHVAHAKLYTLDVMHMDFIITCCVCVCALH